MKWKKLASAKLFEHPRLSVFEDDVELPSGIQTKYVRFGNMKDSAMVLAKNTDGKFLLQKEYSYPVDEVLYQLPGGAIEQGEKPEDGARRELAEEAGLKGTLSFLGWFYVNNRRTDQKMFVYEATDLNPIEGEKDQEELFEEYWLTETEIDNLIRSNEICNYSALAGWALYKARSSKDSL